MEIKTLQIKTMLALTPICQAQCDKIRFMLTDHDMIDKWAEFVVAEQQ